MRMVTLAAIFALIGIVAATAQWSGMLGRGNGPGMGRGMMGGPRHVFYMHNGLPAAYGGLRDPLGMTPSVLAEGRKLYAANCAGCHGPDGRGDGSMAAGLDWPPADLAWTMSMPVAQDDFVYWTIAEGGAPFGSPMPAFKSTLKPNQIWSIVNALRGGTLRMGG